jgi:chromate transporter
MNLLNLAWVFFRIGIVSFGGGWTIVGIIKNEIVSRGWLTDVAFSDLMAISQVTPGPVALNAATLVGFRLFGVLGAAVATLSVVMFPVMSILLATSLLARLGKKQAILQESLKTGTIGLVAMTLWTFLPSATTSWRSGVLAASSFLLATFTKVHPLYIILGAGGASLVMSFLVP